MTYTCPTCGGPTKRKLPLKKTNPPDAEQVLAAVVKATGEGIGAILGETRYRETVRARTIAIHLIHELSGIGAMKIAAAFKRDPSTVNAAIHRSILWLETEPDYKKRYDKAKDMLT